MTNPIADTPLLLSSLSAPVRGTWSPAASVSRAVGVVAVTILTPIERRRWRDIVALTTLFVVPMLIDAIVVLALQGDRGTNAWDIPALQRLLPSLPAGITTAVAVALPTTLLVFRSRFDPRVVRRFAWLWFAPIMLITALHVVGEAAVFEFGEPRQRDGTARAVSAQAPRAAWQARGSRRAKGTPR